ncbi:unnamed protein product [Adineta steineri]|uniref:NAD(P)(+)--arginine ADP-ribosyltransferase n=1 Tax=Adineta steineri TaxID=433720 RepID=A0A815R1K3_9BILA|nr:unnamed protein product [Adineta steineri]CAF1470627.1 unnamed protein product [Adineta steineri]
MPQLDAIYIFCDKNLRHQEWTENWTKIKGVYTNISEICQGLQLAVKQCNQDLIAVSFITVNEMASTDNLNQFEPAFMCTKIFKEILLDIEYDRKAIKDLAIFCRNLFPDNKVELKNIDEFEHSYRPQQAIWWYTRECFTYQMLNRAFQTFDVDIIINMGFFLRDLHQQIQQLYEQKVSTYGKEPFVVYRGQGFIKSDFEKLQKTKDGLISFNNFLSTSKDREVSFDFARCASTKFDMVGILFIMYIDPCMKSVPFASIKEMSYFKGADEILFSMHTVFRVGVIKQMNNNNQIYQVELELISDEDQQLRLLTNRIREEVSDSTGWQRLGNLLLKIGQFNKAKELYNVLLVQTSDEAEKALYYNQLGYVKKDQGDYEKAIRYHEKALEICQKTLPSNHPYFATSYNSIGLVYDKMGDYSRALSFYEKALQFQQKTLPSNHSDFATSYNNIGFMYKHMSEYSKALSFYEKALGIRQKTLSSNYSDFVQSYNNIGNMYDKMGEYSKALLFYEKALEIRHKILPSNHLHLANSYNNIGNVYNNMGEHSKALSFYEKTVEIRQKTLPSNHSDLTISYNNIGNVYNKMGEHSKALVFYEKTVEIQQKSLSSNHPDLATSYHNIGLVYNNMAEYSKALSFYEQAVDIRHKALPLNHASLVTSYKNIGLVYNNMGKYSKVLSFYEKALEIQQRNLPLNHPDFAQSYSNIGNVYDKIGEYEKALSFHEKALKIRHKTLPPNYPDLATSYNNIGSVYGNMGEYCKALSSHEKALEIQQKTLPSNLDCAQSYSHIGWVYRNMKDYSKALSYYERALDIKQRALPPNHPSIKDVKETIEIIKKKL